MEISSGVLHHGDLDKKKHSERRLERQYDINYSKIP